MGVLVNHRDGLVGVNIDATIGTEATGVLELEVLLRVNG